VAALQVRDVPDDVHETLRRRSVREGVSLSEYVLRLLMRESAHPTMTEWLATLPAPGTLDAPVAAPPAAAGASPAVGSEPEGTASWAPVSAGSAPAPSIPVSAAVSAGSAG